MSVSTFVNKEANQVAISINGKFDCDIIEDFREAYQGFGHERIDFTIDLRNSHHLDSSALGMLLNMKRHFDDDTSIRIINCNDFIRRILKIARFDKKFIIE